MDRKEFITKSVGLIMLGGLSIISLALDPKETKKYKVIPQRCNGCGHCFDACRDKALITTREGKADIDQQKCKGCGDCIRFCRRMAIVEKGKSNK
jgi:MinD superfamily P-loop ATPase